MEDHYIKKLIGVLYNVLVKVDYFILRIEFIVINYEIDQEIPIIIRRPFFETGIEIIDMEQGEKKFHVQNNEVPFWVCKAEKQSMELQVVSIIDVMDMEVD